MALRLAWSTCRSARFRRDGSWESQAAVAGAVGALALAAVGCGAESHANDPRPQVALQVSVAIGTSARSRCSRRRSESAPARTQQIPQNQNHPQPAIRTDAPPTVVFVTANLTGTDTRLEIRGPRDASSGPIPANSTGTLQTACPPAPT